MEGYLFPYSALSNAVDYFSFVFPKFNILFPVSTVYMWFNLLIISSLVFFRKSYYTSFKNQHHQFNFISIGRSWTYKLFKTHSFRICGAIYHSCLDPILILFTFIDFSKSVLHNYIHSNRFFVYSIN